MFQHIANIKQTEIELLVSSILGKMAFESSSKIILQQKIYFFSHKALKNDNVLQLVKDYASMTFSLWNILSSKITHLLSSNATTIIFKYKTFLPEQPDDRYKQLSAFIFEFQ